MSSSSATPTYILFRHGKAKHNLGSEQKHTFAGSKIDLELEGEGIEDAYKIAKYLLNIDCDTIISSQLKRSFQTAEIIKGEFVKNNRVIKHLVIDLLKEIDIGDFANKTQEEVLAQYPEEANNFYEGNILKWHFPNGESYSDIKSRIKIILDKLVEVKSKQQFIPIIGHSMLNRVMMFELKMPEDYWKPRTYPHDKIIEFNLPEGKHEQRRN